jgi:hypothetical protein
MPYLIEFLKFCCGFTLILACALLVLSLAGGTSV